MKIITQTLVKRWFDYDAETGILRWRLSKFGIKVGDIAGRKPKRNEQINIRFMNNEFYAEEIIWIYVHGKYQCPKHINCINNDNRLVNLEIKN